MLISFSLDMYLAVGLFDYLVALSSLRRLQTVFHIQFYFCPSIDGFSSRHILSGTFSSFACLISAMLTAVKSYLIVIFDLHFPDY